MAITDKEQEWRNQFGENLRSAMEERGMTQLTLAYEINKSPGDISNYVNGRYTPSAYAIYKMASVLQVTPNQLCGVPERDASWVFRT